MLKIIKTDAAPSPIGPYNQAVLSNNTLYMSGQIAINPNSGELEISSLEEEVNCVMGNIKAVLAAADMGMENIVKTTIFLSNMDIFVKVNAIYATYFTKNFPARETVEVSCLPKNVNVEISVIAVK